MPTATAPLMIPDNSPAGTLIATASVTMSDGSAFAGIVSSSNPSFIAVSGMKLVLARALSPADDGTQNVVITATTAAGATAAMRLM